MAHYLRNIIGSVLQRRMIVSCQSSNYFYFANHCKQFRFYYSTLPPPAASNCKTDINKQALGGKQKVAQLSSDLKAKKQKFKFSFGGWRKAGFIAVVALGGVVAVVFAYFPYQKNFREKKLIEESDRKVGKASIGGPWQLVNTGGQLKSNIDFLGQWYLIYFGFTNCPDICPDELQKLAEVLDIIEADDSDSPYSLSGFFFTVDPARDTPERIENYLTKFRGGNKKSKIVGFSGSKEQVEKVCKTFRIYSSKSPKDAAKDYLIDHSIVMYLIDPEGKFVDFYTQQMPAEKIADMIRLRMLNYKKLH